jgi:hypothetical protein
MSNSKPIIKEKVVPYLEDDSPDEYSGYGGIPALKEVWEQLGVSGILDRANIRYGQAEDKAGEMAFLLMSAPFVRATSQRRVTQRFGGEVSEREGDLLLGQQLQQPISQRTLNRFVNTERYQWLQVQSERIKQLQRLPGYKANRKGVVIIDDWPLLKPYAKALPYLSAIWDNNLKCSLLGYAIVHLYYYHPRLKSYCLGMFPWFKTSLTGEKKEKKKARRAAREDEEMSKLDVAFMLVDQLVRTLPFAALVFDSWYTARWLGQALTQLGRVWIGDAKAHQKFVVGNQYLTVAEIYERYRPCLQSVPGQKKSVKAVTLSATIQPDSYTKVAQSVKLVLVTGLHEPRDNDKGYKLLVCNRTWYRTRRIIRLFSYRPHIEQVHRLGKQEAGWLDFHSRSVPALLCHLTFCLFRCDSLALLQQETPAAHPFSARQLIDHCLQITIRLVWVTDVGWTPALKPGHVLWSFYSRPKAFYY